ncbi:MAG: glycosyltransferase family 2 protein [Bacteroidota bacterium]
MGTVEISVIVPIYKIEAYLPKCVESLLQQTFSKFELILVNDGSPDGCSQICDDFAEMDSRIKVVHKENGGLLSARKAGLKAASGKYISFVDGDDWVDRYYLDILVKLAEANSSDLVVTGHFREFDGKIETIKPKSTGIYDEQDIKRTILPKAIFNGNFCEHGISTYVWNKLFKKELLSRILFDIPNEIIMGEDAAITYSYLCLAKNLVVSRIPLYYYRQRHDSIVKSIENQSKEYYRLGLLTNFLKTKLGEILPEKNLNKQITNYLYSQILVRSGGLVLNKKGDIIFNPFLNVKRNAKIVVYSSGSFGQHILSTNTKTNFLKIVRWIDVDFHDLNVGGNKVRPLSSIKNEEFDHLIIATINPTTYSSIKNELGLMGINEQKIVQINTDEAEIGNLLLKLGFKKDFSYTLE